MALKQMRCGLLRPVRTYASRVISTPVYLFKPELEARGAYAINTLIAVLDDPQHQETSIFDFITQFKHCSFTYANLRKLKLIAPYATLNGRIVSELMSVSSCLNELELDVWSFNNPMPNQWHSDTINLKVLEITLADGIAYKNAFNEILDGLETSQSSLSKVVLQNNSPHPVKIKSEFKFQIDA